MNAILLKTDGTYDVVSVSDTIKFADVYPMLDCSTIDIVPIRDISDRFRLELLVDDEGMLVDGNTPSAMLVHGENHQLIFGDALLVMYDKLNDRFMGLNSEPISIMRNMFTQNRVILRSEETHKGYSVPVIPLG